ncbi:MAG: ATP-binding protein [Deltaproteobacteria bacterium]|nr:ATP-binding protein [Deltaproteobacteria bacterium]
MTAKRIHILLLEDNPDDALLCEKLLKEVCEEHVFDILWVDRFDKALRKLKEKKVDLILTDLGLPDINGLETVRKLIANVPDLPIVVLTGTMDQSLGIKALRVGAQDYLLKEELTSVLLNRTIQYAMERKSIEKLKDEFISVASHEIRTPLAIIKEGVSNLKDGIAGSLNREQNEIVDMTARNIDRLRKIVDNILNFSRLESGKVLLKSISVDLAPLIAKTIKSCQSTASANKISLHYNPNKLPMLFADSDMIVEVLNNLIDNGIRFAKSKVEVSTRKTDNTVEVTIFNDGPLIDRKHHDKLFQKFSQAERPAGGGGYKGTGLGLAICREVVNLHQGKIWIENKPHRGVAFHFTLPFDQPEMP